MSDSQVRLELAPVHAVGYILMVISGPQLRMVECLWDVSVSIVVIVRHELHWMGPLVVVMMVEIHQLI